MDFSLKNLKENNLDVYFYFNCVMPSNRFRFIAAFFRFLSGLIIIGGNNNSSNVVIVNAEYFNYIKVNIIDTPVKGDGNW